MQTSMPVFLFTLLLGGIILAAAVVVAFHMRPAEKSRKAIAAAMLPSLLMCGLFYSLAIHMHQALGQWPESIGNRGFPAPLLTHASIATSYFGILVATTFIAGPVLVFLCLLVPSLKPNLYYLGVYAVTFLVSFGSMLLAPSRFLHWWWD